MWDAQPPLARENTAFLMGQKASQIVAFSTPKMASGNRHQKPCTHRSSRLGLPKLDVRAWVISHALRAIISSALPKNRTYISQETIPNDSLFIRSSQRKGQSILVLILTVLSCGTPVGKALEIVLRAHDSGQDIFCFTAVKW